MTLDTRAIARGALLGLLVIVPISLAVEILERNVDDLEGSGWMFIPFVAVLAAYVAAGRVAATAAPDTPLSHGALAALVAFAGWLLVRVAVPLVQGDDLGFGVKAIVTNAIFAAAFGLVGGALSARDARV
jgi:hypothetical protein